MWQKNIKENAKQTPDQPDSYRVRGDREKKNVMPGLTRYLTDELQIIS